MKNREKTIDKILYIHLIFTILRIITIAIQLKNDQFVDEIPNISVARRINMNFTNMLLAYYIISTMIQKNIFKYKKYYALLIYASLLALTPLYDLKKELINRNATIAWQFVLSGLYISEFIFWLITYKTVINIFNWIVFKKYGSNTKQIDFFYRRLRVSFIYYIIYLFIIFELLGVIYDQYAEFGTIAIFTAIFYVIITILEIIFLHLSYAQNMGKFRLALIFIDFLQIIIDTIRFFIFSISGFSAFLIM